MEHTKSNGTTIHVLDLEFNKNGITKLNAELVAKKYNSCLPSINQFALNIDQNTKNGQNFYNQNKDMRYWVKDPNIKLPDFCKLNSQIGLVGVSREEWEGLPSTEKVLVKNGPGPISIKICDIECSNQIMVINANNDFGLSKVHFVAIVGKPNPIEDSIQAIKTLFTKRLLRSD